jgi:hypothetical protein
MLPTVFGRFASARRAASIGTLLCGRQAKRAARLGFSIALGFLCAVPQIASAAGTPAPPVDAALADAPAPSSTAAGTSGPLPPPPTPRSGSIPPAAGGAGAGAGAGAGSFASAPAAAPPGAPGNDLPPLPRPARGTHLHDGFYLRLGVGLGLGGALISSDSKSVGDYSFGGGAGAFDLWIGGTPVSGLAMGAALSGLGLAASQRSVDGNRVAGDASASTGLLGYFVDVFPDPERGLHFGGALGLASGQAELKDNGRQFQGGGLGLQAFGGYDFWVTSQWSLGGLLRFIGSVTRQDDAGVTYEGSLGAATLSFTALYH